MKILSVILNPHIDIKGLKVNPNLLSEIYKSFIHEILKGNEKYGKELGLQDAPSSYF